MLLLYVTLFSTHVLERIFTFSKLNIGAIGLSTSQYGQGGLPILIDGVDCVGGEEGLLNCSTGPFGIHGPDCSHATEVGVACSPASE